MRSGRARPPRLRQTKHPLRLIPPFHEQAECSRAASRRWRSCSQTDVSARSAFAPRPASAPRRDAGDRGLAAPLGRIAEAAHEKPTPTRAYARRRQQRQRCRRARLSESPRKRSLMQSETVPGETAPITKIRQPRATAPRRLTLPLRNEAGRVADAGRRRSHVPGFVPKQSRRDAPNGASWLPLRRQAGVRQASARTPLPERYCRPRRALARRNQKSRNGAERC
jgi:hypothetical protein